MKLTVRGPDADGLMWLEISVGGLSAAWSARLGDLNGTTINGRALAALKVELAGGDPFIAAAYPAISYEVENITDPKDVQTSLAKFQALVQGDVA